LEAEDEFLADGVDGGDGAIGVGVPESEGMGCELGQGGFDLLTVGGRHGFLSLGTLWAFLG
jgi:hypothetical protein